MSGTTRIQTGRFLGALSVVIAMALPAHVAQADGGRGPDDVFVLPRPDPAPALINTTPTPPAPSPGRVTTPPPRDTATPPAPVPARAPVRQSRRAPPPIIETAPSGLPPEGETRFVDNEVIVRFQLSSSEPSRRRAINDLDLTHLDARTFVMAGVTVHRYQLPPTLALREVIARLEASPAVVNAQPNYWYVLQQSAGTGKLPQFANDRVELLQAHARTKGANTRIAVIDTAVDAAHPELANSNLAVFDVTGDGAGLDPHGTSIAGILAAGEKLTGVAPGAEIISIAAFSKTASGETLGNSWTVLEATNVAHAQNADIVNMSFAGPSDPLLERAMNGAKRLNILPIAAAGNEGPNAATLFPAGYDAVLAVTATDTQDAVYSEANTGAHVDIAAPGVGLLILGNEAGFRTSSGTSLAAAYISGIAALALSANPRAGYDDLRTILENSASDLGAPGKDNVFGSGVVSAATAVTGLTN